MTFSSNLSISSVEQVNTAWHARHLISMSSQPWCKIVRLFIVASKLLCRELIVLLCAFIFDNSGL